ncbi:MAG: GIY-YIG nuclease family protein [Nostoc sp. SerVER01]|nr:GIY-YIG nuclease family protein [Nostoc sp. SerVER01]
MTPEAALFTPTKLSYSNGVVYLITNFIDGKRYVGLTTTSLDERWGRHLEQVLRKDASLLHKAIASFGKENFTIEVIDSASSPKELRAKEREWIEKLNTLLRKAQS